MAESPDQCPHTSAYDRAKSKRGEQIPSTAFDLKPVSTAEAGREIRETPVDELRQKRKQSRKNPTGKRIRRDAWLSPLRLKPDKRSDDAEVHAEGVRSSDRGFLNVDWETYWGLLRWAAKQSVDGLSAKVPKSFGQVLRKGLVYR
nr:hypothetical protein [Rhodopirellula sp. MGV]